MPQQTERKILLVEDEAIIALKEERTLQRYGFAVVNAHTGSAAIEAVRADPDIDLVLMDIDLGPGMMGTAAAQEILSLRSLPVVFLTMHAEMEMVRLVKGITRYGYVLKNAGEFVLLEAINMAFELFESHRRAEESRLMYQRIFEQANDAIFIESTDDRVLDANRKACELLGYTREELKHLTIPDLQAPEVRRPPGNIIRDEVKRSESGVFESTNIRKDGTRIPVEISTAHLDDDRVISVVRDISERKQVVDQLKTLLDDVNKGVAICAAAERDGDFVLLDMNESAAALTGLAPADALMKSVSEAAPRCLAHALLDLLREVAATHKRVSAPRPVPCTGGSSPDVAVYAHELPSGQIALVFDEVTPEGPEGG
ncbi:MAG: PAS domain S-box protein [Spirochaetota bacterium]